ncbi:MAG: FdtA/QdtA family cupin domain-containing protein [Gemmatimonadota bacterium]
MTTPTDFQPVQLPRIPDVRGNLTFVESERHVPFRVARIYWLYDVPGGESRGGRAHRRTHEFVIALSGSFDVVVGEGTDRRILQLNRSYVGLHLPPLTWRSLENFSTNSVCLVLASLPFDERDVVRDYAAFSVLRGRAGA